jgi:hypothetical protein
VTGVRPRRERSAAALSSWVSTNQVRYSLLTRRPERQLLPYAVTNRRLLIAWSPLEQGLLSGKYGNGTAPRFDRPSTEYFSPENLRRAQPVMRPSSCLRSGCRPCSIPVRWRLAPAVTGRRHGTSPDPTPCCSPSSVCCTAPSRRPRGGVIPSPSWFPRPMSSPVWSRSRWRPSCSSGCRSSPARSSPALAASESCPRSA